MAGHVTSWSQHSGPGAVVCVQPDCRLVTDTCTATCLPKPATGSHSHSHLDCCQTHTHNTPQSYAHNSHSHPASAPNVSPATKLNTSMFSTSPASRPSTLWGARVISSAVSNLQSAAGQPQMLSPLALGAQGITHPVTQSAAASHTRLPGCDGTIWMQGRHTANHTANSHPAWPHPPCQLSCGWSCIASLYEYSCYTACRSDLSPGHLSPADLIELNALLLVQVQMAASTGLSECLHICCIAQCFQAILMPHP